MWAIPTRLLSAAFWAQKTAAILEQSGVTVIVAGDNDSIQTKTAMGDKNLAAYVAIHTNAGTGVGTDCYYNASSEASKNLAQAVYDPVAALTPTADQGLIDGSQSGSDNYQYEIGANKSPSCLIEVEYQRRPERGTVDSGQRGTTLRRHWHRASAIICR